MEKRHKLATAVDFSFTIKEKRTNSSNLFRTKTSITKRDINQDVVHLHNR